MASWSTPRRARSAVLRPDDDRYADSGALIIPAGHSPADRHADPVVSPFASLSSRNVSTGPSHALAVAVARPDSAARAAASVSMASVLPRRRRTAVGLVDLGHLDALGAEVAGRRGAVGAGALHPGSSKGAERACPGDELLIALGGGREDAAVQGDAEGGDDGCGVDVLVGVDAEQDLLRGVERDVTRGSGLWAA
ncbi:hypothetical protein [Streptomyces sp. NPDC050759]|uniref:hypothetical protein n=1 Tax=Streptomyces sp. NPDC050759 TaxID=3365635 RepID=UPI00378EE37C